MGVTGPTGTPAIPLTVLTGFLGSGKTTILSRLVRRPEMANTAVIVNELGEIGLDHMLVTRGEEEVVLLDSGCLCCAIGSSVGETLIDLYFRRAKGDLPPFDRVVIETTGLADPAPILHTLLTGSFASRRYRLDGVVVTVDGLHGIGQLDRHVEAAKQAAVADRILITKTDVVPPERIAELSQRLNGLNPRAPIRPVAQGDVAIADMIGSSPLEAAGQPPDARQWLGSAKGRDHPHEHGRHDARIRALSAAFEFTVDWAGYAAWTWLLRRYEGERLLRVKGLMRIGPDAAPYVVQAVQHAFAEPVRLDHWPDAADPRGRIVLIVHGLEASVLDTSLAALKGAVAAY